MRGSGYGKESFDFDTCQEDLGHCEKRHFLFSLFFFSSYAFKVRLLCSSLPKEEGDPKGKIEGKGVDHVIH